MYNKTKDDYVNMMKLRTKKFAVDIINFCNSLKLGKASSVITYQLIKSATSSAANYRASCKARSNNEFYSKISIVVEETDESEYWLEVVQDANLSTNTDELSRLLHEVNELNKIMSKSRTTVYKKINNK